MLKKLILNGFTSYLGRKKNLQEEEEIQSLTHLGQLLCSPITYVDRTPNLQSRVPWGVAGN